MSDIVSKNGKVTWDTREAYVASVVRSPAEGELICRYLDSIAQGVSINTWLKAEGLKWSDFAPRLWKRPGLTELQKMAERLRSTLKRQQLEAEADRRAMDGVDKPVFHMGRQCGSVREFSDQLLKMRLQAEDPDKYTERRQVEHKGQVLQIHTHGIQREAPKTINLDD